MKFATVLAMAAIALSSVPFIAQQPDTTSQQQPDTTSQQNSSTPASDSQPSTSANPSAPAAEMRPVKGELVGKLDSKSAKAGDSVVVKTKEPVRIADGTVIPKGSKLVGQVTVVQSHSQGATDSAVAIHFDHAELKGGQNLPIESVIKSVAPPESDATANAPGAYSGPSAYPQASAPSANGGGMTNHDGMAGGTGPTGGGAAPSAGPPVVAGSSPSASTATAGKVVGKFGNDSIVTTAIPGVYLASNMPSEATKRSGTLFAAKSDVHLDGGTQMALDISAGAAQ